jgi:hypothetical protein
MVIAGNNGSWQCLACIVLNMHIDLLVIKVLVFLISRLGSHVLFLLCGTRVGTRLFGAKLETCPIERTSAFSPHSTPTDNSSFHET